MCNVEIEWTRARNTAHETYADPYCNNLRLFKCNDASKFTRLFNISVLLWLPFIGDETEVPNYAHSYVDLDCHDGQDWFVPGG